MTRTSVDLRFTGTPTGNRKGLTPNQEAEFFTTSQPAPELNPGTGSSLAGDRPPGGGSLARKPARGVADPGEATGASGVL